MIFEWTEPNREELRHLFENYQSARAIIFPALEQGRGKIWVDTLKNPSTAHLVVSVLHFFAGESSTHIAEEMIRSMPPMRVMMAPTDDWNQLFRKVWSDRLGLQVRTRFSPEALDINYLRKLRDNLDDEYTLERVDLDTAKRLDKRENMHIPLFFGSSEEFIKNGIGFCIKHEDKVVSMASTFTPFINEFEVQVMTNDDSQYRRKGLATVVSAALIIYSLEHDLVPYWDAANEISVRLALRLGYSNPTTWDSFYVKPD